MILDCIATVLALVAIGFCIAYVVVRLRALRAYQSLLQSKDDNRAEARTAYWALDRQQKRIGVVVLITYAITFLGLAHFLTPLSWLGLAALVGTTCAALVLSIAAQLYNDKESTLRMLQRYRYGSDFTPTP